MESRAHRSAILLFPTSSIVMKTRALLPVLALLLLTGCATQSVSLSQIEPSGERVTADVSRFNLLGLMPLSLEQTTALVDELREKCGGRAVTGITTRTSNVYWIIGTNDKVEVVGYCVP